MHISCRTGKHIETVGILRIYVQYQRHPTFSAGKPALVQWQEIDGSVIFSARRTFANCLNAKKAELNALKKGLDLAAPGAMTHLILRVIVEPLSSL
jgi:hypothetical protein